MNEAIASVHAIWLAQDDPKKNTAVKLSKRGELRYMKDLREPLLAKE